MKQRDDLFAKTDKEIDAVLAGLRQPRRNTASTPAPASVSAPTPQPNAQPRTVDRPETDHASGVPGRVTRSVIFASLIIWGVAFPLWDSSYASSYVYYVGNTQYYGYDYNLSGWLVPVIALLVHGIVCALILRRLEPTQQPVDTNWLLRSSLAGGPFNGYLLRRVSSSVSGLNIGILAALWIVVFLMFAGIGPLSYGSPYYSSYYNSTTYEAVAGSLVGLFGGLATSVMLIWVRRRRTPNAGFQTETP